MVQNFEKAGPADRIEGFSEVQFENYCGEFAFEAETRQILDICEIFRDISFRDETRLVTVDKHRDQRFQAICQQFCAGFHGSVLKGDRSKGIRGSNAFFLGQKDNVRTVNSRQVSGAVEKTGQESLDYWFNYAP